MESKYDVALMVKAAELYYIRGMKQEEIARELKIARSTISSILTAAREARIVEISIHDPQANHDDLSQWLATTFELMQCLVVPTAAQNPENLRRLVTQRAAKLIGEEIQNRAVLGLAWGRTCHDFISVFNADRQLSDVSIVPLIGGSNQNAPYFQINEMVRRLAEKMQGRAYFIHAPANPVSMAERNMFMQSSAMQSILELWQRLDIVITGIGSPPTVDRINREQYIGESEIFGELEGNAVGDICARYFNTGGQFITNGAYEKIICIPIENLKRAGKVVAMASGLEKAQAIRAALLTGVITTFITDEQTALAVCRLCNS